MQKQKTIALNFRGEDAENLETVAAREGMRPNEFVGKALRLAHWLILEMARGNRVIIVDADGKPRREVKPF